MTRSFSFRTAGLLLLGACLSLPLSAKESAEGFSRQVALSLQGEGPWYRLSIPMSVQLSAAHADLRDLRVFDAEGEALPYALVAGSERQAEWSRVCAWLVARGVGNSCHRRSSRKSFRLSLM